MYKLEKGREKLYQWDKGQRLILDGAKAGDEVHFFRGDMNVSKGAALVSKVYEENGNSYANIPNIYLTEYGYITCYLYLYSDTGEYTAEQFILPVREREKPSTYVYTETEVFSYKALERKIDAQVAKIRLQEEQCKQYALLCNEILQECKKLKREMEG